MAICAPRPGMFTFQPKIGATVVKRSRIPAIHLMTLITSLAKLAIVNILASMAINAFTSGRLEIGNITRLKMTLFAAHLSVFALQSKQTASMIKFMSERFHPIMTIQAAFAVRLHMFTSENLIKPQVTFHTGGLRKAAQIIRMTIFAAHRAPVIQAHMRVKCKAHLLVWKSAQWQLGQARLCSTMLRMAISAGYQVGSHQHAMQRSRVLPLSGQILMATLAQLIHRSRIPGRRVTASAVIANFGMRLHPSDRVALFVIQRPG